ncbi:MAG: hypothetical protein DMG30_17155 [Acidobacteria bacterium]|nr:MAG: hypothetical protein DMG30_17155 [Acidobacteriota bacterium]
MSLVSNTTGRLERRTARTLAVELCGEGRNEKTFTENVSPRGARVVTEREWQPSARVLLICPEDNVWLEAEIVYYQRLAKNRFAVGLELSARVERWAKPR